MTQTFRLGDFCEVFIGKHLDVTNSSNDNLVRIINSQDINKDLISKLYIEKVYIENDLRKLKELQNNDIIFSRYFSNNMQFAILKDIPYAIVLPSNTVICIRVIDNSIDPWYLKIFLESPNGQMLLESLSKGKLVKNIYIKDIEDLEIPFLSQEEQNLIVSEYKAKKGYIK